MENQVLTEQLNQPQKSNFIIILLSVLLFISLAIAGFFAFQTQKLVNELTVLRSEPTPIATAETTVEPIVTNSPVSVSSPIATTPSQIPGWNFFTNNSFTFQYPSGWKIGQGNTVIVSDTVGAGITIFNDSSMMNECMKVDKTDTISGKMVKYYSYIYSGEMCTDKNQLGNYQVWITKAGGEGYGPGVIYSYNTTSYPKSFEIFKQILSTFKFIK